MSEVLAGLAGGLLALAGAFGVQWAAGRQVHRQRGRQISADFLAAQDAFQFLATDVRRLAKDSPKLDDLVETVFDQLVENGRLGYELVLLCRPSTAALVRAQLELGRDLTSALANVESSVDEWDAERKRFRAGKTEVQEALALELGLKR